MSAHSPTRRGASRGDSPLVPGKTISAGTFRMSRASYNQQTPKVRFCSMKRMNDSLAMILTVALTIVGLLAIGSSTLASTVPPNDSSWMALQVAGGAYIRSHRVTRTIEAQVAVAKVH